jgi:hypothetical protein
LLRDGHNDYATVAKELMRAVFCVWSDPKVTVVSFAICSEATMEVFSLGSDSRLYITELQLNELVGVCVFREEVVTLL